MRITKQKRAGFKQHHDAFNDSFQKLCAACSLITTCCIATGVSFSVRNIYGKKDHYSSFLCIEAKTCLFRAQISLATEITPTQKAMTNHSRAQNSLATEITNPKSIDR
jgi:hypothetical protein